MGVRKYLQRLSIAEWRALGRAARQLQACAEALTRSTWQGAPAILVNLAQVHETIAELYNKNEAAALQSSRAESSESPQDPTIEGPVGVAPPEAPVSGPREGEA